MTHEIALTKLNRIKLAHAFRHNRRVDLAINGVVEGQMGRAFADDFVAMYEAYFCGTE